MVNSVVARGAKPDEAISVNFAKLRGDCLPIELAQVALSALAMTNHCANLIQIHPKIDPWINPKKLAK
jgi:hypothetical protein